MDGCLGKESENQILRKKIDGIMLDTFKFEDMGENDGQNDHQEQGIEHRPEETDERAFITNGNIPLNQGHQQMGMCRQIPEFLDSPDTMLGVVDENRRGRRLRHARIIHEIIPA